MKKENLPEWINDLVEDERLLNESIQTIKQVEAESKIIEDLIQQAAAIGHKLEDVTFTIDYKKRWSESVTELNRRHYIIQELQKENRQLKNETTR